MNRERLAAQLRRHEGFRRFPYKDTEGILSIGYGRNLIANGVSEPEARIMLNNDIDNRVAILPSRIAGFGLLDDARQEVLLNMSFNLGVTGLLGFQNTLKAAQNGDWERAAAGILASKAAKQTGQRYIELAEQMRTGIVKEE